MTKKFVKHVPTEKGKLCVQITQCKNNTSITYNFQLHFGTSLTILTNNLFCRYSQVPTKIFSLNFFIFFIFQHNTFIQGG